MPAAPVAQTEQQPVAVADAGNWEKSFGSAWPVDDDEPEGAWIIGTIDEDENKYPIIAIEADQYDAPGESEKIAKAIIALWSQAFAAPIAQTAQLYVTHRPLIQNAISLLRIRRPVAPDVERVAADLEAMLKGQPTPAGEPSADWLAVADRAIPQPEQSGLVEALRDCIELIETLSPVEGDTIRKARAALSAQGGQAHG